MHGLLKDKVVVVAGYGYGLGASLAEQAALQGAQLVISARTEEKLETAAKELRAHRVGVLCVPCDFDHEDAGEVLAARTLETYGQVDVLLNNAFRMPPMDPLTKVAPHKIQKSIATNVIAPLRLASAFADGLSATNGSIVMINSAVLWQSQPEFAAYKLTKGAMLHMSESLATELGPRGIRVNSLAPSWIYEDINKAYFDVLAEEAGVTHQDIYDEKAAATDLRRLATPDEVANAALLLASPLASAVTGVCLDVSCGEFHR
ncbi:SDR family oxidoreductase [Nocardioides marmoribigeumensis]|uniref:NAD(P)-dependent dehydrogenase (Short-subunit alcohol dehydrogenase family) n=1 Tax=Nocardioides marmoribigeumensis TaxID=433649 RepID=A0ABU2BVI1_9ACTN|nr:SDR family oxidoreductase [Nocardioides marmoribigeumensis]MDR7362642.1 NAD(P)-dependent dehydrogenase (short-subunit alcohol dehydrogenase family) [Nocardioides marmoribigeumensis]